MSGTTSPSTLTVASPPATASVAADIIAWIGGQSGVLADFNPGSQVRTDSEAIGSVVEIQSVIAQAQAFQAIVYAAWEAFNIIPFAPTAATVPVVITTGVGANPPLAPSPILIPAGTVVQTVGGIQFETSADATIPTGATSVTVVVNAVVPGLNGNVSAGAIVQIATALSYPLQVSNAVPATGGADAESPAQTMARFTALVASIGLATPVAIANGAIGITAPNSSEKVEYATVYEPWIEQAMAGVKNPAAGFTVYVDNGSGAASPGLLAAVSTALSGNFATGAEGFRPAGVPYSVLPVVPVFCSVQIFGKAIYAGLDATLNANASTATNQYFESLFFGETADITQLIAAVANVVAGNVTTLSVTLLDATGASQQQITANGMQRVVIQNLTVAFS